MTKTLNDVKSDMSALYEELRGGKVEIKVAAELANITGKFLKAEQLQLAREIFENNRVVTLIESKEAEADRLERPK
jgi:hypothetical protein